MADVARRLGLKRILTVTDAPLVDAGIYAEVARALAEQATLDVFVGGEPEPSLRVAELCAAHAREFGPDGLIGLGGGSNMDLAKMTATLLAHGGVAARLSGRRPRTRARRCL